MQPQAYKKLLSIFCMWYYINIPTEPKTMSYTGRPKKLPSQLYQHRVKINLTESQINKLDRICEEKGLSYTEYFRSYLAKDKR